MPSLKFPGPYNAAKSQNQPRGERARAGSMKKTISRKKRGVKSVRRRRQEFLDGLYGVTVVTFLVVLVFGLMYIHHQTRQRKVDESAQIGPTSETELNFDHALDLDEEDPVKVGSDDSDLRSDINNAKVHDSDENSSSTPGPLLNTSLEVLAELKSSKRKPRFLV